MVVGHHVPRHIGHHSGKYLPDGAADEEPSKPQLSGGMEIHPDAIRARRASMAPRDGIVVRPSKSAGLGAGGKASRKSCSCDASAPSSGRGSEVAAARRSSIAGGSNAKAQRRGSLHQRRLEQEAKQLTLLESWFEKFDSNGDKQLDREELQALLTHLYPGSPPDEGALDFLVKKATEIRSASMHLTGNPNGLVPWAAAVKTVARYGAYLKEKGKLDALLRELDVDESGGLDKGELGTFLRRLSPDLTVTDDDVEFMLEQCDVDNDGAISRDEVIGMVQVWRLVTTAGPEKRKGRLQSKQISILSRGRAKDFQTAASERQTGTTREPTVRESEDDLSSGAEAGGSSRGAPPSKPPVGLSKQSTVVCVIL